MENAGFNIPDFFLLIPPGMCFSRKSLRMRFPPPIRITAPLLALLFGLAATWLDYRLNLDLDLARHLSEVRDTAEAHGRRLARLSERLFATGQRDALIEDVQAMGDLPTLEIAAIVDDKGRIVADSTGTLTGQPASRPELATTAALIGPDRQPVVQHGEDDTTVAAAHPFAIGKDRTGWILLAFDRTSAMADARTDALAQLRWMASAMGLLSFALWAALYFGFVTRLSWLAQSMRDFGAGKIAAPEAVPGGDEVGELSDAVTAMAQELLAREKEKVQLERELLEISEREQHRIGHDLHDGLGQRLTAASMATNAAVAALQKEAPAEAGRVADIGRQLREAIAETRALAHGLAPVALKEEGLANALRSLAENTTRSTNVRCVLDAPQPVALPDTIAAVHLYRIAQEAVNNALKHARPGEIRIGLEPSDGGALLEIDDDGEGLPDDFSGDGIGMRVMRHRSELIGGIFTVGSPPAGGTRIACRLTWKNGTHELPKN